MTKLYTFDEVLMFHLEKTVQDVRKKSITDKGIHTNVMEGEGRDIRKPKKTRFISYLRRIRSDIGGKFPNCVFFN